METITIIIIIITKCIYTHATDEVSQDVANYI